eukprot:TRINITY_DN13110_c0_g1_i15.p1 TRINITY_DN13110_c0_g1~~TRINITY_DN13110_c0_g1_i15.p1  ORF type:complete len:355 (-),score=40.95 TRINITY_DN13110_c0_g1_i15:28-945(-)
MADHMKEPIEEMKIDSHCEGCIQALNVKARLNCGHTVCKDCLVLFALKEFLEKRLYERTCFCALCNRTEMLRNLILTCGCVWTNFQKKLTFTEKISDVGRCDEGHSLIPSDISLVNNFPSFKLASLMIEENIRDDSVVSLYNKILKNESLETIEWALKYTNIVTELDLSFFNIQEANMKAISKVLEVNKTLMKLRINSAMINNKSAMILAEALKANTTLKELSITRNGINEEGMECFFDMLRVNETLEVLNLSSNEMGDKFYEGLRGNKGLKQLNLAHNGIKLSLIHICRCRRSTLCRSRWSPYH